MKVLEKTHSKGIILSFPDKTKGKRDNWKSCKKDIQREIKKEINSKDWVVVIKSPKCLRGILRRLFGIKT